MGRMLAVVVLVAALGACEPAGPSGTATTTTTTTTTSSPQRTDCVSATPRTARDVRYGTDPLQRLDLTVPHPGPRCRPVPVVVWVHGGGFAVGDKANGVADKVRWATAQGWAFASVNYRLSPAVQHPAHVSDLAAAVRWLVDHAAERGLDPDRILLAGHSAGAFLVALLGTDDRHLEAAGVDPDRIRAVAALDTRYDIAAEIGDDGSAEAMYRNAFGDDPAVWHDASPLTHAAGDPDVAPFLVVTRGTAARRASARTFADAIVAGEGAASLLDVTPLSHEQVNRALGASDDTRVTPAVTALFRTAVA